MEKLTENDLTYFYLRHVVIVVTSVTTISLPPVKVRQSTGILGRRQLHKTIGK
jgi:hypothetical protein